MQMAPTPLIRRKKEVKRTKKFARNQSDLFNRVDVRTLRPTRSALATPNGDAGCDC
jgi:ribosomal protein L32E